MAYVIISDEATPLLYGGFTFKYPATKPLKALDSDISADRYSVTKQEQKHLQKMVNNVGFSPHQHISYIYAVISDQAK